MRYYFILTCYYEVLFYIIAYKQSQYIATYFFMQGLQAIKCQAQGVHGQLTNNIWNVDRLVAVSVHQDCFLLALRWKWIPQLWEH